MDAAPRRTNATDKHWFVEAPRLAAGKSLQLRPTWKRDVAKMKGSSAEALSLNQCGARGSGMRSYYVFVLKGFSSTLRERDSVDEKNLQLLGL